MERSSYTQINYTGLNNGCTAVAFYCLIRDTFVSLQKRSQLHNISTDFFSDAKADYFTLSSKYTLNSLLHRPKSILWGGKNENYVFQHDSSGLKL